MDGNRTAEQLGTSLLKLLDVYSGQQGYQLSCYIPRKMTETGRFTAKFEGLSHSGSVQNARLSDIKDPSDRPSDPPVQESFTFEWEPRFQVLNLNLQRGERVAFEIQVRRKLITRHPIKYERVLIGSPTNLWRVLSEKK
jgi:hypothetical protein